MKALFSGVVGMLLTCSVAVAQNNTSSTHQEGNFNEASVEQLGNHNQSTVIHRGNWNDSYVSQSGNRNKQALRMTHGNDNYVGQAQHGDKNNSGIEIWGNRNNITTHQDGDQNHVYANFRGTGGGLSRTGNVNGNWFHTDQYGDKNLVDAGINGSYNGAFVLQWGENNRVGSAAYPGGDGAGFGMRIVGNCNFAGVAQGSYSNSATVMTTGNGNRSSIAQDMGGFGMGGMQ